MLNVKDNSKNYYGNDLTCSLQCGQQYEDQEHLLECEVLMKNCEALYNDTSVNYEDIFTTVTKELDAVRLYPKITKIRNDMMDEITTRDPGPVHQLSAVDEF